MEYPGSHFKRIYRRIFLGIFIASFFIIAPLLVFYTAGYRYDFKNGIVREIGAVSVDILPLNATVFLNDIKIDSKMPIRLKNVTPGKYKIKISANGFYDWEKDVIVDSKQTVYIKEIQLIKKSEPQKIVDGQIDTISYSNSQGGRFLIYKKINANDQEFYLFDLQNNQNTKIFSAPKDKKYEIQWTGYSDYAMMVSSDLTDVKIFSANNGIESLWNINSIENEKITKIQWGTGNNDIYYSTKNKLAAVNATSPNKNSIVKLNEDYNLNSTIDWAEDGGKIWSIVKTTSTNQYAIIKDTLGFAKNYSLISNLNSSGQPENWKFVTTISDKILLKNSDQKTMLLFANEKHYNIYGDRFLNSPYNNWWVLWTPWELTTYSQGEEPFLLNRSGEQLHKVIVLDKHNTLGLIWADKMTALFPYYFVSHNLINIPIKDAVADSQNRVLYYSAKIDDKEGVWKFDY